MRAALVIALVLLVAPAAALGATPRTTLHDVEDEVMCNVCGTPLNVSDSPQADRERAFIVNLIERGYTKQQVKDAMVRQFGAGILDVPRGHGFDLTAYLVPGLAIVLAGGVVAVAVTRWRRTRTGSLSTTAGPSSKDSALLREDLERYDL